jgi:hypothetical protein
MAPIARRIAFHQPGRIAGAGLIAPSISGSGWPDSFPPAIKTLMSDAAPYGCF